MRKRNNLEVFLSSETGKRFFNFFYSWGAAVVIIGAMFKIIHLPHADIVLMVGMITEAVVFVVAGFDNSDNDTVERNLSGGGVILGSGSSDLTSLDTNQKVFQSSLAKDQGTSSPSVVILGSAGTGQPLSKGSSIVNSSTENINPNAYLTDQSEKIKPSVVVDHNQSVSETTTKNLEDFSNTIQSLNEASQKILSVYDQISGANNFVDNLTTLNQNVSGLNDVFSAQLETITEQMSAIRYINDSLNRMKNLYDGAIGDSYMFKEESAKMTKHIEALNNVYARLLQAMTTNNNPNQIKF